MSVEINQKAYRIGFNGPKPFLEENVVIGVNNSGRAPLFFLAPINPETGDTEFQAMRTVQADGEGKPNGFFATIDEAKTGVKEALDQQIAAMQQALTAVEEIESLRLTN